MSRLFFAFVYGEKLAVSSTIELCNFSSLWGKKSVCVPSQPSVVFRLPFEFVHGKKLAVFFLPQSQ